MNKVQIKFFPGFNCYCLVWIGLGVVVVVFLFAVLGIEPEVSATPQDLFLHNSHKLYNYLL